MRRHAVGILALILLVSAVVIWLHGSREGVSYQIEAHFLRIGTVLAVFWLAYSDLNRVPPWLWVVFLPMLVVVLFRPRWLILMIPIALLLAVLHPRVWPSGHRRRTR